MDKRKKPMSKIRVAFILCCCTLPVISWLIFYVYANLSSFSLAFTDKTGAFTFDNFARIGDQLESFDSELGVAVRNTALTFAIAVASYPFKWLVSYFLYKKIPGAKLYRILFFLPGMIFSVAFALTFKQMIGINGFIAQAVQKAQGLDYTPTLLADSRYANWVVLLHKIWMDFPGNLIIYGGAFSRIPDELLESARLDGANWWQEFIHVIIPLVWPTVALQLVMMSCGIFNASGDVFLLTEGKYGTMTLSSWMYLQVYSVAGNVGTSNVFNYMSAVGLTMTTIAVLLSLGVRRFADKVFKELEY